MRLLFAAGGTGGTVLPAITVAESVRRIDRTAEIRFVGTTRGFETRLVPKAGFELVLVKVGGLKRMGFLSRLRNLISLPVTFWQSWGILRKFKPHAVFGTGGYASGPVLLLAAFLKVRTAVLEPNSVPGFANRLLSRFVKKIYLAFEEARASLPKGKCEVSGLPIRREILSVTPPDYSGPSRVLLVFGGSQGARKLNDAMLSALPELGGLKKVLSIIHQTGVQDEERVRASYRNSGFVHEIHAFIDDMAQAYAKAHLVLARSGSSVLELAAVGRPAILVPYPYSADDHQQVNAKILETAGAALIVSDAALTGAELARKIRELVLDSSTLMKMSQNALKLRKGESSEEIAKDLLREAA